MGWFSILILLCYIFLQSFQKTLKALSPSNERVIVAGVMRIQLWYLLSIYCFKIYIHHADVPSKPLWHIATPISTLKAYVTIVINVDKGTQLSLSSLMKRLSLLELGYLLSVLGEKKQTQMNCVY